MSKSPHSKTKQHQFAIQVASPKYQQFASQYLNTDGTLNNKIRELILERPNVKGVNVAYDFDTHQWCLDIVTNNVATTTKDPVLSKFPCRILSLEAAFAAFPYL